MRVRVRHQWAVQDGGLPRYWRAEMDGDVRLHTDGTPHHHSSFGHKVGVGLVIKQRVTDGVPRRWGCGSTVSEEIDPRGLSGRGSSEARSSERLQNSGVKIEVAEGGSLIAHGGRTGWNWPN